MKKIRYMTAVLVFVTFFSFCCPAFAAYGSFAFSDERFQGGFSTEVLDQIILEYELFDGWYWTTPAYTTQTFHGAEDAPGWTDTAVNKNAKKEYIRGIYGCRWICNKIRPDVAGSIQSGTGECFGFAQFIGYLLSGEYNLYKYWDSFYDLDASGGLRVGDVVRTEFEADGKKYAHSAVVYSVSKEEILFLQVSGGSFNRISVGTGFTYGYRDPARTLDEIMLIPRLKIYRSPLNSSSAEE